MTKAGNVNVCTFFSVSAFWYLFLETTHFALGTCNMFTKKSSKKRGEDPLILFQIYLVVIATSSFNTKCAVVFLDIQSILRWHCLKLVKLNSKFAAKIYFFKNVKNNYISKSLKKILPIYI